MSYLPTQYDDMDQFVECVDVAEARCLPFNCCEHCCDLGTNSGRLCWKEKEIGGKTKLVDFDGLERSVLDWEQAIACKKEGSKFSTCYISY